MTQPRFAVPRTDRRDCALYRIMVVHPTTGKVVLGYIGETARQPFTRFMEHLYDQPWGDTIVGHPHVDPRVFAGKAQVCAAEEAAVRAEKPLYNIEFQKGAPHQIPQWTAREQRAERDRQRGTVTPDWSAKAGSVAAQHASPGRWREILGSPWTWWLAGWLVVTLGALLAVTWLSDETGQDWTLRGRFWTAVILASAAVGWLWWRWSGRRRWRRFVRRR